MTDKEMDQEITTVSSYENNMDIKSGLSQGEATDPSKTDNQVSHSRPISNDSPEDWNNPTRNIAKLIGGYYGFIVLGMSDSSIGVLLPSLEAHYDLDYLIVSLAFLTPFIGYTAAALLSDKMHRLIGRWGVCVMGAIFELICYIVVSTAPPFPVFVVMYGVAGFGNGFLDSTINSWVGGLHHSNQALGLLHGFYGLGGIICPATFTAMIAHGVRWNYCYFLMIAMSALSAVIFFFAFRGDTGNKYREGIDSHEPIESGVTSSDVEAAEVVSQSHEKSKGVLKQVFRNRLVWLLALTLFLYVGAEVSFGGWISTFMIKIRHGAEKEMGYVTTGFWAGLTVGRMTLGFLVGHYQAEDYFVISFLSLAIACLLFVWLVPVLGVSAAFAALFGVSIGPLFPTIVSSALQKLPKRLHVAGLGFCVAIAGGGAAVPPFINGVIANRFGPGVLGPFCVVLLGLMLIVWLLIVKLYPIQRVLRG